jgi:hypothetical protein
LRSAKGLQRRSNASANVEYCELTAAKVALPVQIGWYQHRSITEVQTPLQPRPLINGFTTAHQTGQAAKQVAILGDAIKSPFAPLKKAHNLANTPLSPAPARTAGKAQAASEHLLATQAGTSP